MSPAEKRAGAVLAAIFALRMLGLFIILPVFAVYASTLRDGHNATLVGMALGIFGAVQALLHIPLGLLSDRIGRRPVIVTGLLVFAAGSFVAATADSMMGLILGRAIQGAGAISAAVTALAADLTRESHRTKVMAMIGSVIGLMFALSLILAPALYAGIGMSGIFILTGLMALGAVLLLSLALPRAPGESRHHRPAQPRTPLLALMRHADLMQLNGGVFVLHCLQTALWVAIPPALVRGGLALTAHWKLYLPVILIAFVLMIPAIIIAEKRRKNHLVFVLAIVGLLLAQLGLALGGEGIVIMALLLTLFFTGFNIMEALQPALISRLAPADAKGAAMGVYNTTQSVGLACGGAIGGWIVQSFGAPTVYWVCTGLVSVWLLFAVGRPVRLRPSMCAGAPSATKG